MSARIHIELKPLGEILEAERGTALQDLLNIYGVEFPCGGKGRRRGCRIRVLDGALPPTEEELSASRQMSRSTGGHFARISAPTDIHGHIPGAHIAVVEEVAVLNRTTGTRARALRAARPGGEHARVLRTRRGGGNHTYAAPGPLRRIRRVHRCSGPRATARHAPTPDDRDRSGESGASRLAQSAQPRDRDRALGLG
jgi:ferredoxin